MGLNNLPEDTNLSNIIAGLQDRIERLERATRTLPGSLDNSKLTSPIGADATTNVQSFSGDLLTTANKVVATATFVKPAWATQCMVMAISVITTNTINQSTGPLSGTAQTVIAGIASATITINTTANDVYTTKAIPFNRLFTTTTNVTIETQVTTVGGAAANALSAQLAVSVFWYA